jgi:hypothetical protein
MSGDYERWGDAPRIFVMPAKAGISLFFASQKEADPLAKPASHQSNSSSRKLFLRFFG